MNTRPLTPAGFAKAEAELKKLRSVDRPAVIQAIAEARAHGDLSENAEYAAAREKQGFIEARIHELTDLVIKAEVIDPSTLSGERVIFGAFVSVVDCQTDQTQHFQIVGDYEADIESGKLSVNSPIGRALIGKEVGDIAEVKLPSGSKELEIIKLWFGD